MQKNGECTTLDKTLTIFSSFNPPPNQRAHRKDVNIYAICSYNSRFYQEMDKKATPEQILDSA